MNPAPKIDRVDYDRETPLIDRERVDSLFMDDDGLDFAKRLLDLFIKECRPKLDDVPSVCEQNDLSGFRYIVHFIGGSAGSLGFSRMCALYRGIEEAIDAGSLEDLSQCGAPVLEEFEIGIAAFRADLNL